jgi:hypothetical protein
VLSGQKPTFNLVCPNNAPTVLPTDMALITLAIRDVIMVKIPSANGTMFGNVVAPQKPPMLTAKRVRRNTTTNHRVVTQKAIA